MNNKLLIGLIVVCSLVGGAVGAHFLSPILGGDFAGGVVPGQLFTANSSQNSVTPILPNLYLTGAVSVGGTNLYNQIGAVYTTSSSLPATVALGTFGGTTSTASSSFSLTASTSSNLYVASLQVGDPCAGSANTSSIYVDGCVVTAVGGGSATGTIVFSNLTTGAFTVPTSTVFRLVFTHLPY